MSIENKNQVAGQHYKKMAIQPWDYIIQNQISYMEGSVIKYISRWRDKNGLEDLYKCRHFLNKLIETEEAEKQKPVGYVSEPGSCTEVGTKSGVLPTEWVGLTDHELQVLDFNDPERGKLARVIEAKLKERNS
jgi:hypothetical protein